MWEIDPTVLGIIGSSVVALGTIVGFIFKASWWLSDQFKKVTEQVLYLYKQLEDKFDRRHEDNIERFAKIETKLDIVIKNGH